MKLGRKQRMFSYHYADLHHYAESIGLEPTHGAAFRDPAWGIGHKTSLHGERLAGDTNLFDAQSGEYLTDTESHRPLGLYWESKTGWYLPDGSRCAEDEIGAEFVEFHWGGRWGDGNHYSIGHGGMK